MEGKIKCFSEKVKLKKFIITKPLLYEMLKDLSKKKNMINNMNSKMTTNSKLSTTEPKKQKQNKNKQLEQEQNHRNGDHMEDYHWGGRGGRMGEKVQGIRNINGR